MGPRSEWAMPLATQPRAAKTAHPHLRFQERVSGPHVGSGPVVALHARARTLSAGAYFGGLASPPSSARHTGPNSACDVGLPLELTSGLGRDRGESGGLRGVLVAPARHREKLGPLLMGIVGSGCARSGTMGLGLVGSERWISRGLEGSQCRIVRLREDLQGGLGAGSN